MMGIIQFCMVFILVVREVEAAATSTCGEWSSWSCQCCGGCKDRQCTRMCQTTDGCDSPSCPGNSQKTDPGLLGIIPCIVPSKSCKMPLPVCCEGLEAYLNITGLEPGRWCGIPIGQK